MYKNRNPKQVPAAYVYKNQNSQAKMRVVRNGIHVRHTEMITTVIDNGYSDGQVAAFINLSYLMNPGLPALFPWLSGIANCYETWKLNYITIEYQPECATSTPGSVRMMIDPDSKDNAPANISLLMANQIKSDSQVFTKSSVTISSKSVKFYNRPLLVTSIWPPPISSTAGGYDAAEYLAGMFYLGTNGIGSNAAVGKLLVHYDIVLTNPCPNRPTDIPGVLAFQNGPFTNIFAGANYSVNYFSFGANNQLNVLQPGVYQVNTLFYGKATAYTTQIVPFFNAGGAGNTLVSVANVVSAAAPFINMNNQVLTLNVGHIPCQLAWTLTADELANEVSIQISYYGNAMLMGAKKVTQYFNYVNGGLRITNDFHRKALKAGIAPTIQEYVENYRFETDEDDLPERSISDMK